MPHSEPFYIAATQENIIRAICIKHNFICKPLFNNTVKTNICCKLEQTTLKSLFKMVPNVFVLVRVHYLKVSSDLRFKHKISKTKFKHKNLSHAGAHSAISAQTLLIFIKWHAGIN